jgi:hypothetical protein
MDTPTHYELLCVTPDATADEIRNAYRRLIRLYHPDVVGAAGEAMTLRLNDAQHDLLDPAARARYDRGFATAGSSRRSSAPSPAPAWRQQSSRYPSPRVRDDWRPRPDAPRRPPTAGDVLLHRLWMGVAVASIATIIAVTAIVFAWSYAGPLTLTTARVIPPLVVAVAWLVGGLSRPSMLFVALLVIGAALWPLSLFGVPPFSWLADAVPSAMLAALSLIAIAVLALRVSAPLATRLSRVRPSPA